MIASTPKPPYYAVIFTSVLSGHQDDYPLTSQEMLSQAQRQDGFLGFENAREGSGIFISYWRDLESMRRWRQDADHIQAQKHGRAKWYSSYKVRIAKIERDYDFGISNKQLF